MRTLVFGAALLLAALGAPALAQQAASDWRTPDPENLLVVETTKGVIVVEMSPQTAPNHINRIKGLARTGFYDGHIFHRVISDFMAQTGDPQGTGAGGSELPNVAAEFTFKRTQAMPFGKVSEDKGVVTGFVGSLPVITGPDDMMLFTADNSVLAWGAFCPAVAGMARQQPPDTANSQFFFMRGEERFLDRNYTSWGYVIDGQHVVQKLQVGEPPANPDRMVRVRVAADMPEAERPRLQVMDVRGPAFAALVAKTRAERGEDFDICDVRLPSRAG